jgi:ABC-type antimicrobial peptide transport system permease subunit
MYGSAAVVGIMMTHVIGTKNTSLPFVSVLGYAEKLGYAMQLTNFLRDISEDVDDRNRIYMPQDEYSTFEIAEVDFVKHKYPEKWNDFMELQLHRAERFYREADQGIKYLNWYGRLAVRLASRLYEAYHFEIRKSDGVLNQLKSVTTKLRIGTVVIALLTLLGASIGLMNIMLVSVTERTKEIGIRKALGATRKNVLVQFLVEAIVICLMGGIVGIILGILMGAGVTALVNGRFFIPWNWMLLAIIVCLIVGLVSGLYPALKASKLDPIEALRYE